MKTAQETTPPGSFVKPEFLPAGTALMGFLMGDICVFAKILFVALVQRSPDPIVCCVAAWAFIAISAMLSDSVDLNSHNRSTLHLGSDSIKGLEIGAFYFASPAPRARSSRRVS